MGEVVSLFGEGMPTGERPDRDYLDLDNGPIIEVTPATCGGRMHVFATVPGRCRCGAEFWQRDGTLAPPTDDIGIHYVQWEASSG